MEKQQFTALVARAQAGDTQAVNDLMNESYETLYYYAYKTVKDPDLAGDITQESCIEILRTLQDLRDPGAFHTWAGRIVYHQCTRHFKKEAQLPLVTGEEADTIVEQLPDLRRDSLPEQVQEDKAFQKIILDMLDDLSPEHRSAMVLYYYENLPVSQIAQIQGENEGTVKSRLFYGRKAVKQAVESYEKKHGVRLHSTALPLLLYFLLRSDAARVADSYKAILARIPGAVYAANAAAASTAGVAAGTAATTAAATTAAAGIGVKIAAAIAAVAISAAAIAGGVALVRNATDTPADLSDEHYEEEDNQDQEQDLPEEDFTLTREEEWQLIYEEWFVPGGNCYLAGLDTVWGHWSPVPDFDNAFPEGVTLSQDGTVSILDSQLPIYHVYYQENFFDVGDGVALEMTKSYEDTLPHNISSIQLVRYSDGLFELNILCPVEDDPNAYHRYRFYQPQRYEKITLTPENFFDYVEYQSDLQVLSYTEEDGSTVPYAVTAGTRVRFKDAVGAPSFVRTEASGSYIQRTNALNESGEIISSEFATRHEGTLWIDIYAGDPKGNFFGEELPMEELPATLVWQLWDELQVTEVFGEVYICK